MEKRFNLKRYVKEHKQELLDINKYVFANLDKIKPYEEKINDFISNADDFLNDTEELKNSINFNAIIMFIVMNKMKNGFSDIFN